MMRQAWKFVLIGCVMGFSSLFLASTPAQAQVPCSECGPYNYCEDLCQRTCCRGEIYFGVCGDYYPDCIHYSAAQPADQLPAWLTAPAVSSPASPDLKKPEPALLPASPTPVP